jgi:mono/diheme cytochrome c family protein
MRMTAISGLLAGMAMLAALCGAAQERTAVNVSATTAGTAATVKSAPAKALGESTSSTGAKPAAAAAEATARIEGEKRFKSNCGRCHSAPQKFSPRMMATVMRHMRVKASLTEEDTKLILRYLSE